MSPLESVQSDSRPLTAVAEYVPDGGGGVEGVRLSFGEADVYVGVNDDDEVTCSSKPSPSLNGGQWNPGGNAVFWRRAIGRPVAWYWVMRNHRGYDDGFQIDFHEPYHVDGRFTVQLVAMAGRLSVRFVNEVI